MLGKYSIMRATKSAVSRSLRLPKVIISGFGGAAACEFSAVVNIRNRHTQAPIIICSFVRCFGINPPVDDTIISPRPNPAFAELATAVSKSATVSFKLNRCASLQMIYVPAAHFSAVSSSVPTTD
jgi:hypothetical protein